MNSCVPAPCHLIYAAMIVNTAPTGATTWSIQKNHALYSRHATDSGQVRSLALNYSALTFPLQASNCWKLISFSLVCPCNIYQSAFWILNIDYWWKEIWILWHKTQYRCGGYFSIFPLWGQLTYCEMFECRDKNATTAQRKDTNDSKL